MSANALALTMGRQTFDGLGRQLLVEVGGRETRFNYVAGLLPVQSNTLASGKVIEFNYEPQLDNSVLSIRSALDDLSSFEYDLTHSQITRVADNRGRQDMTYKPSGRLDTQTWVTGEDTYVNQWQYSLAGNLSRFVDADQTIHRQRYDAFGRVSELSTGPLDGPGAMTVSIQYDDFSRPATVVTTDVALGNTLTQTLTYDDFDRELTRTLFIEQGSTQRRLTQTLTWTARDQLASRTWNDGGTDAVENYRYDTRSRLVEYTANDAAAPTDPFGNRIKKQVFTLNACDGYETVVSTFLDDTQDTATFSYSVDDPTQVVKIEHTHPSWPNTLNVEYDACGNVLEDGLGRTLTWDVHNRLIKVSDSTTSCDYRYDPSGKLAEREMNGKLIRSFYSGDVLTHEHHGVDERLTFIGDGSQTFAQSRLSVSVQEALVTLMGCDGQGSVRVEVDSEVRTPRYTAHGDRRADDLKSPLGFAGERVDELTGWYIPGGYRPYDPVLMCFLSPDTDSPFGAGGLNPYAYCSGDPVNNIDPDGHAWWNWVVAGLDIALGVVATVASMGAAAPALAAVAVGGLGALTAGGALAVASAGLGVVSLATGVAATVLEATGKDEKAAGILGWVSLGTGLLSSLGEMAPKAAKSISRLNRMAGRGMKQSQITGLKISRRGSDVWQEKGLIYEKSRGVHDVWLHKNFYGQNMVAYETHGKANGYLMNASGVFRPADEVARLDILPRLNKLKKSVLKDDDFIVLVACEAGSSGAAQTVANVIKRPVLSFNKKVLIKPPHKMTKVRYRLHDDNNLLKEWDPVTGNFDIASWKRFDPIP